MGNLFSTLLALAGAAAFAQTPSITAVLDAAGYTANLAQGSVFVVEGTNLCGTDAVAPTPYGAGPLGGAAIQLTPVARGSTLNAYMIYCSNRSGATQLAGEIPSTAALGDYNVTVAFNGTSAPFKITVVVHKFQLMTQSGNGSGRALVQNVVSAARYDLNGFTNGAVAGASLFRSPAKPSEFLIAWGTGLGAAPGFDAEPPAALDFQAQDLDVKVTVGGVEITPVYAGRSNVFPGLDNIVLQLPAHVPAGCSVPFDVRVAGQLSNPTTIAIASNENAAACDSQFTPDALAKLDAGGSVTAGFFNLTSFTTNLTVQGQDLPLRVEGATGTFARFSADNISQLPNLSAAAVGGCQLYRTSTTSVGAPAAVSSGLPFLDAGRITLNGPNISNKSFAETSNVYTLNLGTAIGIPGLPPMPGFSSSPLVTSGIYTLTGTGGADLGPFSVSVTVNPPLKITGGLPLTVNRNQDLNLSWTGGGSGLVLITGSSSALTHGTIDNGIFDSSGFLCVTPAATQSFIVPSSLLLHLPVTSSGAAVGTLAIYTMSAPKPTNGLFGTSLTAGGTTDFAIFTAGLGESSAAGYQ
jgi:uncharacterized protein (TIGR03437 family)